MSNHMLPCPPNSSLQATIADITGNNILSATHGPSLSLFENPLFLSFSGELPESGILHIGDNLDFVLEHGSAEKGADWLAVEGVVSPRDSASLTFAPKLIRCSSPAAAAAAASPSSPSSSRPILLEARNDEEGPSINAFSMAIRYVDQDTLVLSPEGIAEKDIESPRVENESGLAPFFVWHLKRR